MFSTWNDKNIKYKIFPKILRVIFFKKLTLEPSLTSPTVDGPGPTSLPSCCSEIKCYRSICHYFGKKSMQLTGRFFKIVKEGVHISVHSSSITAKLPVISSEYRLLMICPSNSRFLLFVEFIDQWICELEVSFLHLWSQSICNLVTEGISGENELLANIVIWLNEIFFNNFSTK